MILSDNKIEIDQTQNRPGSHENIGFGLNGVVRERTRKQQEDKESDQYEETDAADKVILFYTLLSGNLEYSNGYKAVDDGCSDRRGIHDPANCGSAKERNGQRNQKYQKNRLGRNLFLIKFSITLRQDAIPCNGIAQTADGTQHTDQTCHYQRQQRCHQDINTRISKIMVCGIECRKPLDSFKLIQPADVIKPAGASFRISRYTHKNDENIQSSRNGYRDNQNTEQFTVFEMIFFRRMGHTFKTNKSPW